MNLALGEELMAMPDATCLARGSVLVASRTANFASAQSLSQGIRIHATCAVRSPSRSISPFDACVRGYRRTIVVDGTTQAFPSGTVSPSITCEAPRLPTVQSESLAGTGAAERLCGRSPPRSASQTNGSMPRELAGHPLGPPNPTQPVEADARNTADLFRGARHDGSHEVAAPIRNRSRKTFRQTAGAASKGRPRRDERQPVPVPGGHKIHPDRANVSRET